MTSGRMEEIFKEMKRIEVEHPKATVLYDYESQRINITYPLPKDYGSASDVDIIDPGFHRYPNA